MECAKSPQAFSVDYTIALSKLKIEVEDKNQPLFDGWKEREGVKKNNWKKSNNNNKTQIFFIQSRMNKWEVANVNESLSHKE